MLGAGGWRVRLIRCLPFLSLIAFPAFAQDASPPPSPSLLVTATPKPATPLPPASVAGPAQPRESTKAPAQAAIEQAKATEMRGTPRRCRTGPGGEITVCGNTNGASPYRLPLPSEREQKGTGGGPVDIGGSPVGHKLTGPTLTFKPGKKITLKPTPDPTPPPQQDSPQP